LSLCETAKERFDGPDDPSLTGDSTIYSPTAPISVEEKVNTIRYRNLVCAKIAVDLKIGE
jgi:hypothetical protein